MFFLVFATDKPGALETRRENKKAHVAHLDAGSAGLKVLQTGPWLGDDGNEAGSMLIFEADDRGSVEAFMDADPYARAGLFETVQIRSWSWNRGNPYRAQEGVPQQAGSNQ